MLHEEIGVGDAAANIVILIAAHHVEVGCRQDGDGDADIGETAGQYCHLARRHRRPLGHMTDHDPPAAPVFLGQLADEMDVRRLGRVADIEMNVDVDVVFAGELEDPPDLAGMVVS